MTNTDTDTPAEAQAHDNADADAESAQDDADGLTLPFPDGSEYTLPDTYEAAAERKYPDRVGEWRHAAVARVCEHYEARTEPTRFGTDVAWGESGHDYARAEYDTMAALAPVVIYPDIRAPLMQIAFENIAAGTDEDVPEVRALGPDGEERSYRRDADGGGGDE